MSHVIVVESPSAVWTAQQFRQAFAFASPLKCLLRDRDGIYGLEFQNRVQALGWRNAIAPQSPWQSPYIKRLIVLVRQECLDHAMLLNQAHRERLLKGYFSYYHRARIHLALDKDAPEPRPMQDRGRERSLRLTLSSYRAPSQSCTLAGCTMTINYWPVVSTKIRCLPLILLSASQPRSPLLSLALTDWLSMMAAMGWRRLSSSKRMCSRRLP